MRANLAQPFKLRQVCQVLNFSEKQLRTRCQRTLGQNHIDHQIQSCRSVRRSELKSSALGFHRNGALWGHVTQFFKTLFWFASPCFSDGWMTEETQCKQERGGYVMSRGHQHFHFFHTDQFVPLLRKYILECGVQRSFKGLNGSKTNPILNLQSPIHSNMF